MKPNKKEQDIAKLFGEINTPAYDILEGVKTQMNQKSKRTRPRAAASILIASLILLLTTGAVFAAYQNIGGFGRLREIVGEERAENLTPIEIDDILDIPYLTGGFRNPHEDRFAIELVASHGEVGGIMDFYFTLEDLTGARQNCEFSSLGFVIHTGNNDGTYVFGNAREIIDISDSGIITLRGRTDSVSIRDENGIFQTYGSWSTPVFEEGTVPENIVYNGALTITVTAVNFNVGYLSNVAVGFDLGTVQTLSQDEIQLVTKDDFSADFPFEWQFPSAEDRALLETTGVPLPRTGLLNWEIDVNRVDTHISSIGIIDDKLYLVQWEPMPHYSKFTGLGLVAPSGDWIHASRSLMFSICESGTFYQGNYRRDTAISILGMGYFSRNPYQILIFEGLDLNRLGEYTIQGHFATGYSVWLEWTTTFPV